VDRQRNPDDQFMTVARGSGAKKTRRPRSSVTETRESGYDL
jgi:hypothetical protein